MRESKWCDARRCDERERDTHTHTHRAAERERERGGGEVLVMASSRKEIVGTRPHLQQDPVQRREIRHQLC